MLPSCSSYFTNLLGHPNDTWFSTSIFRYNFFPKNMSLGMKFFFMYKMWNFITAILSIKNERLCLLVESFKMSWKNCNFTDVALLHHGCGPSNRSQTCSSMSTFLTGSNLFRANRCATLIFYLLRYKYTNITYYCLVDA